MTDIAEVNSSVNYYGVILPAHKCRKQSYPYTIIYKDTNQDCWYMELDSQSSVKIYYCPFCGKVLSDD